MAAGGARSEVRVINSDGCPGSCGSNAIDDTDSAPDGADVKAIMSLIGGGRTPGADDPDPVALLFDPESVPAVLASGLPSAITPHGGQTSGAQSAPPYLDFIYVLKHPNQIAGPAEITRALLLSVPSLVGELTFSSILADSNAYFAERSLSPPIEPDLGLTPSGSPPKQASFSTGDGEASPKKAKRPAWMDWSLPTLSQ
jgi:hypothetical protein